MPTLAKLAPSLVSAQGPEIVPSFYAGLAIYFLLGAVMCCALKERALRGALFAGIAAPAVILSSAAGFKEEQQKKGAVDRPAPSTLEAPKEGMRLGLLDVFIASAHAQDRWRDERLCVLANEFIPSPNFAGAETVYSYRVNINWSGSSTWSADASDPWHLRVACGGSGPATAFPLSTLEPLTFRTGAPVSEIQLVERRGRPRSVKLPPNAGGVIQLNLVLETKKDIYWALGGQGIPRIKDFEAYFVPQKR